MADVFVSYASPDRDLAFRIADFLERDGITCWIAPRDVPPGVEYGAAILDGIENCRALVLVLSEHSNDSQFVRKEVERAVSKTKAVLPVRVREVVPSGSLEFFISSAQWVDAWRSPMEQHLAQLAVAIKAITSGGSGAAAPVGPLARKKSRVLPLAIAAAVLVILAGAGLFVLKPWLPAWQKDAPGFLVGSWCQPMSGDAIRRFDLVRADADSIIGELHFSHSTQVERFRARARPIPEGIEIGWTQPETAAAAGPARVKVIDGQSIAFTFMGGEAVTDAPDLTRCPPGTLR
jgi:hypothetical protein